MFNSELYKAADLTTAESNIIDKMVQKYCSDWNTGKSQFRCGMIAAVAELKAEQSELAEIKNLNIAIWHNVKDNIRPNDQSMCIVGVWYDGWNYDIAHYDKENDEFVFHDHKLPIKCTRVGFNDVEVWQSFIEPNFA